METYLISIVIVTRHRKKELERAISSIKNSEIDEKYEIIIMDNNDENDIYHFIKGTFPDVIVERMYGNKGITIPRNIAAKKAKGKYLYFLDDDAWIEKGTIEKAVDTTKYNKNILAVMSNTRFVKSDGSLSGNTCSEICLDVCLMENGFLIEKEKFLELEGFNERIFFGEEGVDLALRGFYCNYFCVKRMDSIVYHPGSEICPMKEKEKNPARKSNILNARCVSAKTSWPRGYDLFRIFKIIFIDAIVEARRCKSLNLFMDVFRQGVNILFHGKKKSNYISVKKFNLFRKLSKEFHEVPLIQNLERGFHENK